MVAVAILASLGGTGTEAARKKPRLKIPALVNVDLRNVLNNLAVRVHLDRANVPINAQIPITLAANVCGVSVNVLAISAANGKGHCIAKTASPKLAQVVQQQIAAGGSVGGGAQGGSSAANAGAHGTGGSGTGGAAATSAQSTGSAQLAPTPGSATTPPPPVSQAPPLTTTQPAPVTPPN
jgi:uncharacterized membrane protein YgcG